MNIMTPKDRSMAESYRYEKMPSWKEEHDQGLRCDARMSGDSVIHISNCESRPALAFPTTMRDECAVVDEEDILFPSYEESAEGGGQNASLPRCGRHNSFQGGCGGKTYARDDIAIQDAPSVHVDYLSHDWIEADLLASWRYVAGKRSQLDRGSRLQNAAWRSWSRIMLGRKAVDAGSLGWSKDCDITWLYGPLQDASTRYSRPSTPVSTRPVSESSSRISRKSCLKRRSIGTAMLTRSQVLPTLISTLPRTHPSLRSDSTSNFSPCHALATLRKVQFCEQVEQCVVDFESVDGTSRSLLQERTIIPLLNNDSRSQTSKDLSTAKPTTSTFLQFTQPSSHISHLHPSDDLHEDAEDPEYDWLSYNDFDFDANSDSMSSSALSISTSTASLSTCSSPTLSPAPSRTPSPPTYADKPTKPCCRCHLPMPTPLPSHTPSSVPLDICAECIRSIVEDLDSDDYDCAEIDFRANESFSIAMPLFASSKVDTSCDPLNTSRGILSTPRLSAPSYTEASAILQPHTVHASYPAPLPSRSSLTSRTPTFSECETAAMSQPFAVAPTQKSTTTPWVVAMQRVVSDEGYGSEDVSEGCVLGWEVEREGTSLWDTVERERNVERRAGREVAREVTKQVARVDGAEFMVYGNSNVKVEDEDEDEDEECEWGWGG